MPGVAKQGDPSAHQLHKWLNIMNFYAVRGGGIDSGDKLLHRRRPAGEIAGQIGFYRGAVFRQAFWQRHVKKEVEAITGDGHQRHALAFAHECRPLVSRRDGFVNLYQPVPVHVARVAALGLVAKHPGTNNGMGAVGGYQHIALGDVAVCKSSPHAAAEILYVRNALAELNIFASIGINQHVLQFGAGDRIGAFAHAVDKRVEAKAGHGLAADMLLIGHILHRSPKLLQRLLHAEPVQALHAVGPHGDRRAHGFNFPYRLIDFRRNTAPLQSNGR